MLQKQKMVEKNFKIAAIAALQINIPLSVIMNRKKKQSN